MYLVKWQVTTIKFINKCVCIIYQAFQAFKRHMQYTVVHDKLKFTFLFIPRYDLYIYLYTVYVKYN